ncbi:Acylphosphatase family protein [Xylona heveae TC161]|uniref:Acylphosphatase n=1 Tax=Xylona heveae (strain CBS 132557 / TC161) TaxID=1328760 RepID=A0A165I4Z5_XYLHT|nr:Acylphosphatase family protein [Xylona heveae TC161]KZF24391.1 Acylphosphatase family protein [Xylona heveae TC161]
MSQRIAFKVHGTVQGVNFRSFTKSRAESYGLTGWVKNSSDGKVIGEAQGDQHSIDKLVQDLNKGPSAAQVTKLDKESIDTKVGESGFQA